MDRARYRVSNCAVIVACLLGAAVCPAAAQADRPVIRAELLNEIGGDESPVALSAISDASFDASGRLVILDHLEGRVYVVRTDGTLAGAFGRKGAGPGEFRGLDRLGWKRDTLWIFDAQLRRISYFAQERFVRSEPYNVVLPTGFLAAEPLSLGTSGDGLGIARFAYGTLDARVQQGYLMFRMRGARSALDTLRWLTRLNSELSLRVNFRGAPADIRATQPLSDAPLSAPRKHGGAVVVERSGVPQRGRISIRVQVYSEDGAVSADRTLSLPARPMTSKIRDEVRSRLCVRAGERSELPTCDVSAAERALYTPAAVPVVSGVTGCVDGGVWLRLAEWPRTERQAFVRLTPDARIIGWLLLPPTTVVLDCQGDLLATAESAGRELSPIITLRRVRLGKR